MKRRAAFLLFPAILLSGVGFLLPFAWLVAISFKVQGVGSLLLVEGVTLANYRRLFDDGFFAAALVRTLLLSLAATALCLCIGLPVARLIAVSSGRAKGLLLALVLTPLVCGALLPALGMFHLFGNLGVINGTLRSLGLIDSPIHFLGSLGGLLLGLVQAFLPLMVLPLVNVLSRLPPDVEAAARSLGAASPAVWRRIILPLAQPGITAGATLVFSACFTAFVTPQVLGQGHIATFGTVAYQQAALVLDWPFASTLAVVALLLLGLLFAGSVVVGGRTVSARSIVR